MIDKVAFGIDDLEDAVSSAGSAVGDAASSVYNYLGSALSSAYNTVGDAMSSAYNYLGKKGREVGQFFSPEPRRVILRFKKPGFLQDFPMEARRKYDFKQRLHAAFNSPEHRRRMQQAQMKDLANTIKMLGDK